MALFYYVVFFVLFIIIYRYFLREPAFAWFCSKYCSTPNPEADQHKKCNFSTLSTLKSHDPKLKKDGAIRILEIGPGTGVNFKFFPDGTRLVVVDSNPSFIEYFKENRKKFTNIHSEEIIISKGEEMDMVASESIDAVVMTHVMCSVDSVPQILKQIHRVLVPEGKFYFFEHVKEFDAKFRLRGFLQEFLTLSGIWPLFFVGCMLNREMVKDMQQVGFRKIEKKRVHMDMLLWIFKVVEPHLIGVACK